MNQPYNPPSAKSILVSMLEGIRASEDEGDVRWWTQHIKRVAWKALHLPTGFRATLQGYQPEPSEMQQGAPEYLVDLCITRDSESPSQDPEDPFAYTELLLALESEWSTARTERSYDFCKLADVRAVRKIFVGAVRSKEWPSVLRSIVQPMADFWNQHSLVREDEEVGVLLSGSVDPEAIGAWVIKRGQKEPQVVVHPQPVFP